MPYTATVTSQLRSLIIDPVLVDRQALATWLQDQGHQTTAVATLNEATQETTKEAFDLIFLDSETGLEAGWDFEKHLLGRNPWSRLIVTTPTANSFTTDQAMNHGASDLLAKPLDPVRVLHVARRVIRERDLKRTIESLQAAIGAMDAEADIPAVDSVTLTTIELARRVAGTHANLVLQGEVGSGRCRLARSIHLWSDRRSQPFAAVICRANAGEELEVELFGSREAGLGSTGKVEFCDGGTLVLQEVNQLPMQLQPRILRLVQDHEFERQDETTRRPINLRIIATTSVNLQQLVDQGQFRADLLLALNVVQIEIPPLRERHAEVPVLARRYADFFGRQNHKIIAGFTPEAMHVLTQHCWPGNIRELRNVIERAVLLSSNHDLIRIEHLPPNLLNSMPSISPNQTNGSLATGTARSETTDSAETRDQLPQNLQVHVGDLIPLAVIEELHVRKVVASTRSLRQAAVILGIDAGTVVRRMKRYNSGNEKTAKEKITGSSTVFYPDTK